MYYIKWALNEISACDTPNNHEPVQAEICQEYNRVNNIQDALKYLNRKVGW